MRFAAPAAVFAATIAAATSATATTGTVVVEAHPVARVGVETLGWGTYAALSLLALAVGIRAVSLLPLSAWGVRVIATAKVVDAVRDAWLAWPWIAAGDVAVPGATVLAILVAGAVSTYVVAPPGRERWTWRPPARG